MTKVGNQTDQSAMFGLHMGSTHLKTLAYCANIDGLHVIQTACVTMCYPQQVSSFHYLALFPGVPRRWDRGYSFHPTLEALIIPRLSHHPVFDRLQYTKNEGGGLVHFVMWIMSTSTLVVSNWKEELDASRSFLVVPIQILQACKFKAENMPLVVQKKKKNVCSIYIVLSGFPQFTTTLSQRSRPSSFIFAYFEQSKTE